RPVDGCKALTLELDGDRLGVAGAFRFRIPRDAVDTGAFAPPAPPGGAVAGGGPAAIPGPAGQRYYRLVNKNSGLVLEVVAGSKDDRAKVTQGRYEGKPHQEWELVPAGTPQAVRVRNRN